MTAKAMWCLEPSIEPCERICLHIFSQQLLLIYHQFLYYSLSAFKHGPWQSTTAEVCGFPLLPV